MFRDFNAVNLFFALAAMVFAGCASTLPTSSNAPSPPVSSASPPKAGGEKPAQVARQQTPTSSLDAHREGNAPVPGPLAEIFFDFDSHDLSADARKTLQAHAAWLKANPAARVEIEGHCDERGATEYNLALGAKRARSARDYLVTLGIAASRISTTSYGEELPVCKAKTDDCYRKNRRDRFVTIGVRPAS